MNGLKKFFGLQSQSEKIKEYRDCLNQMDSIEQQTAALANAYALNKSQTDEILKSEDLSTKVRVAEQFKAFVESQTKDIQNLYLQRVKIEKSMSSLERDEDIADVLKDIKQLHDARHAYRTGAIKKSVYFDLLKAKSGGPVKFADVILWRGDKILILNRAGDGGSYTDEWCVPGGHVDAGESFRDAACRELCEETGIDLDKESLQEVAIYKNKDVDIHYFMGHITAEAPTLVRVDGMEEIGSAWINPVTEIEDYKFIFDMKDNLKRILGLEDQDHLVPLLKSFSKGKVSEKVVQDYLTNHPDALQKAENKHYFSHTERKDLAKKGEAMPNGKYPIRNSQDLHDAIRLVGRSSMPESEVKAWIKKRAKALGLTDELPDSWKEKVEKDFGDEVEKSFTEEERRELAKKGEAMPDGKFPIRNGHDLKNAIKLRNNSDLPEATVKAWIIKRAKALGLESELPEEWGEEKLEKSRKCTKIITIECVDCEDSLEEIINEIKNRGNVGHSFSIVIDPDDRNRKTLGWDGDGGDYIGDIKVTNKEIEKAADTEDANQLSSEHLDPKQKKVPPVPDMYAQNVNLEKAKESEKQLFNTYLNFIEGAKTRIKNIHWGEEDNSKHVYLDDLTELVSDFEDLFSEAAQAGFGRFKDGEIQAEEVEEDDPVKIAWLIYNRTIELRKHLEEKELYWGEISYMDDFLVKLKQSVYRLQMH